MSFLEFRGLARYFGQARPGHQKYTTTAAISFHENLSKTKGCPGIITSRDKTCESIFIHWKKQLLYRIVASTSSSRFEAHTAIFRLLMKGIFYPYVL